MVTIAAHKVKQNLGRNAKQLHREFEIKQYFRIAFRSLLNS